MSKQWLVLLRTRAKASLTGDMPQPDYGFRFHCTAGLDKGLVQMKGTHVAE